MNQIRQHVIDNSLFKTAMGRKVNGTIFLNMAEEFVFALNLNNNPNIQEVFESAISSEARKAKDEIKTTINEKFELLEQKFPMNESDLISDY